MTTPNHTDVFYTAEFIDGPLAGDSEERVLVHGTHDEKPGVVALVDGIESIFRYTAVEPREIAGKLHVTYAFNEASSDPFESDDENEKRTFLCDQGPERNFRAFVNLLG